MDRKILVYIDHSGSENILRIAGLNFYEDDHNLLDENWITPIKG